jgi:hypothetical protein
MPMMGFSYMLQFLDKQALGQSAIMDIMQDLVYSAVPRFSAYSNTNTWYFAEIDRQPIFLGRFHLLFLLFGLFISRIYAHGPPANWKITRRDSVRVITLPVMARSDVWILIIITRQIPLGGRACMPCCFV